MQKITIAIVDDHPLAIHGIKMMLADYEGFEVIDTYNSGNALLNGLAIRQPDILLLDILLGDYTGNELALMIHKQYPTIKMIALTSLDTPAMVKSMLQNGCNAYLLKGTDQATLHEAIITAYRNEQFIEPELKEHLLNNFINPSKQNQPKTYVLTKRETEILKLIVEGDTTTEIADKLCISPRTADTHRLTLLKKLMAKNTAELVSIAFRLGLVT